MRILFSSADATTVAGDLLVLPVYQPAKKGARPRLRNTIKQLDGHLDGWISERITEEQFTGAVTQTMVIHAHRHLAARRVAVLGLGETGDITLEQVRRFAGRCVQTARQMQARRVVIDATELYEGLSDTDRQRLETTGVGQAVAEGLQLAQYAYEKYKKSSVEKKPYKGVEQVTVIDVAPRLKKLRSGAQRGEVLAQAVHYARDLVNEPALDLTPRALADHARTLNRIPGMTVKIMTEAQMKKLGMGAILSVSAGSEEPAYFVHLRYTPPQSARTKLKKLAICGKGITYDSGGLSIKPSNYMDTMKMDMAGAAIILALFSKLPRLSLQGVELHGVFAATENMPSGKATRPGDVVTAYNGTTIEINNTDAEGRLILADTLAWTIKTIKPAAVIDVATLTGAAIVALGQEVAPVMGTDQTLIDEVLAASQRSGEAVCQFPLLQEYMPLLNSDIADVQNSPKTIWAGSIIGGLFLQKFVGDTPWLHMDIAGPAWVEKQLLSYAPLGASGFGVRLLWEWLASHSKRP